MDKNANRRTIEAYNANVEAYIKHTPHTYVGQHNNALLTKWLKSILEQVRPGGKILEIGSATPRDAQFIRSNGFDVLCSDASVGFVKRMNEQGEPAILLNILEDDIEPNTYDLIFANAVVQHFTVADVTIALKKIYTALKPGGIFAFNVKAGEGEAWINIKMPDKRFTHYWHLDDLNKTVEHNGYQLLPVESWVVGDTPDDVWLRVTAQKPPVAN